MKAVVWSKYHCTFCDQALALLKSKDFEIEERKIGDGYSREELLEAVPTARSVPQIFIGEKYIGGFDDLKKYLEHNVSNYGDGSFSNVD
jgi:glutaredoxin 3